MENLNYLKNEERLLITIVKNAYNKQEIEKYVLSMGADIDWNKLLVLSGSQRVFPLVYCSIKSLLPEKYKILYAGEFSKHARNVKARIKETGIIISKAKDIGLAPCVAKGFVLSQIIYKNPYMREFSDVDMFIQDNNIVEMCKFMENCGYTDEFIFERREWSNQALDFTNYYLTRAEMKFISDNSNYCIEVKSKSGNIGKDIFDSFFKNIEEVYTDKACIPTFDIIHTFLILISNTYVNFNTPYGVISDFILRDLCDFYYFLLKHPELDYDRACSAAEKYGLKGQLKYVLNLVKSVFGSFEALEKIEGLTVNTASLQDVVSWKSDFIYRIFNRNIRVSEMNEKRLKSAIVTKTNGVYPMDLRKYKKYNIIRIGRICPHRMGAFIKYYNDLDFEVFTGYFWDGKYFYASFYSGYEYRKIPLSFNVHVLAFEAGNMVFKCVSAVCTENSTSIKRSDIEGARVLHDEDIDKKTLIFKIPLGDNMFYGDGDGATRKIFAYFRICRHGYEGNPYSMFTWGQEFTPIMFILA